MILPILQSSDQRLYEAVPDFIFENNAETAVDIANNLIETMIHHGGLGLAATQCGMKHRVFVMHSSPTLVCFNPRVVTASNEVIVMDEGCLTFPNLFLKVKRPQKIKVRYADAFGEVHTQHMAGMTARIFLHELDHLNGKVYTQRANPVHLKQARQEQKKIERQMKLLDKFKVKVNED